MERLPGTRVLIRYILFLLIALMVISVASAAEVRNCGPIINPLQRLNCYDIQAAPQNSIKEIVFAVIASPTALAAIFAAIVALVSGVLGPLVTLKIGSRQAAASQTAATAAQRAAEASMLTAQNAGNREIARLRIAWIDKLRDTLSDYHAMLMSIENIDGPDQQKLLQLGTQLDLLLNQNEKAQKALWDVADAIFRTEDFNARRAMDPDLIRAGRIVIDGEWRKIKAEMKGERFQN